MDPDVELYQEALRLKRRYRKQRDALRKAGDQLARSLCECRQVIEAHGTVGQWARSDMALNAWAEAR